MIAALASSLLSQLEASPAVTAGTSAIGALFSARPTPTAAPDPRQGRATLLNSLSNELQSQLLQLQSAPASSTAGVIHADDIAAAANLG